MQRGQTEEDEPLVCDLATYQTKDDQAHTEMKKERKKKKRKNQPQQGSTDEQKEINNENGTLQMVKKLEFFLTREEGNQNGRI